MSEKCHNNNINHNHNNNNSDNPLTSRRTDGGKNACTQGKNKILVTQRKSNAQTI